MIGYCSIIFIMEQPGRLVCGRYCATEYEPLCNRNSGQNMLKVEQNILTEEEFVVFILVVFNLLYLSFHLIKICNIRYTSVMHSVIHHSSECQ